MAGTSLKHIQIDKANSRMILVIAVALFITIFSLVSIKTLYSQLVYQNHIASAKQTALNQLKTDVTASQQLIQTYSSFNNANPNYIGASSTGTTPPNVSNAYLMLDALPSKYDYPALTSSIQYLLNSAGVNIDSIGGTDEQATISGGASAEAAAAAASPTPTVAAPGQSVAMPFQFSVDGPYTSIQNLFSVFQKSIRPIAFQTIEISGDQSDLTLTGTAQTYYQPATSFKIATETIK